MANPLETGAMPPPAAVQDAPAQNSLQQGAPPQGAPAGPGAALPPPPSHEQTVAALRHFHAITEEIQHILKDPAVGKSDLKSKIIDGVTKLVSERMISPAQAVVQLSSVPSDPIKQRQWLTTVLQQTVQAANNVVDHHASGHDGTLDFAQESQMQHPHADDHMNHMSALEAKYGGR